MPASAPPAPATPAAVSVADRFAVLRRPGFALLFAATSVSTLGSAMTSVVLVFALLAKGYSASAAGVVIAAQAAPTIVLLLAGGVAGDRWPRRAVMVGADLLRLASQGALALLLLRGHPPLAALMALAGCGGVGNAFYGPAESGLVPQAAGPAHIAQANSLISLVGSLTTVVGPSLGGLIVATGGASLAFGLDAASYGLSACLLSLMQHPDHAPPDAAPAVARSSFAAELREGWGEFRRHRWLGLITVQFGLLNLVTFPAFIVLGAASFAAAPGGVQAWGLVISASGAGGVCGGLLLLRWRPRRPLVVVEGAALLVALPVALLAAGAPALAVAGGGVVLGLGPRCSTS
ncbi:MAG: MFS transporter [Janthinobacterium lividum]